MSEPKFSAPLAGRTALITGASSGVGHSLALAFVDAGARVVVGARRRDRLDRLVREIEAAGGQALAVALDVADEASMIAAYDAADDAFGGVDTVVANAGVNVERPSVDLPIEEFDGLMTVNLRGAFLTAREGARRMIARRPAQPGRVLFVASIAGLKAIPGLTVYCASKAGVVMMAQGLAREWARHEINVNALCPGFMRTDINSSWFDSEPGQRQIAGFPRRRLMTIDDITGAAVYLCSTGARATTGAALAIDDAQLA